MHTAVKNTPKPITAKHTAATNAENTQDKKKDASMIANTTTETAKEYTNEEKAHQQ